MIRSLRAWSHWRRRLDSYARSVHRSPTRRHLALGVGGGQHGPPHHARGVHPQMHLVAGGRAPRPRCVQAASGSVALRAPRRQRRAAHLGRHSVASTSVPCFSTKPCASTGCHLQEQRFAYPLRLQDRPKAADRGVVGRAVLEAPRSAKGERSPSASSICGSERLYHCSSAAP